MTDIHRTESLSYIELSLYQIPHQKKVVEKQSKKAQKKPKQKKQLQPKKTKATVAKQDSIKKYEKKIIAKLPNRAESDLITSEKKVTKNHTAKIEQNNNNPEEKIKFVTATDYFQMLNMLIRKEKKYPKSAKIKNQQGAVKVEFVLLSDGTLDNVKIVKSSYHRKLDNAAITAVKNAQPFPEPPLVMFKPPLTLQITILFKLV